MIVYAIIVALVTLQRFSELRYANRNTRALLARGAVEVAPQQYPCFIALHGAWLIACLVFAPPGTQPVWWLILLYTALQAARIWVIASLGPYWTTRIITLPDAPLVQAGPYALFRHPNYLIVALEIAVLPLAFHEPRVALVFSALNALLLAWRIPTEERALAGRTTRR